MKRLNCRCGLEDQLDFSLQNEIRHSGIGVSEEDL
jgi:hypothetical protein